MSKIKFKTKSKRSRHAKEGKDLERVIWDPEYRAMVRERLNRPTAQRPPAHRKRS